MQNSGVPSKEKTERSRPRMSLAFLGGIIVLPITIAIVLGRTIEIDFNHGDSGVGVKIQAPLTHPSSTR